MTSEGFAPDAEACAAHAAKSLELELACDFRGAATEALAGGDLRRALFLSALAGDEAMTALTIARAARELDVESAARAGHDLAARGFGQPGGELLEAVGAHADAARAFAEAGDAARAAECFDRAGQPAEGARVIESALRLRPGDGALRLALGRLLVRHRRVEQAAKALQQIPADAPERPASLPLLRRCLRELGLEEASRAVEIEMKRLGVAEEVDVPRDSKRPALLADSHGEARGPTPQLLFGRYEIVREVAVTAHARVVEAIDRVGGGRVAVKLLAGLDDGAGRDAGIRFEREARALAALRHPNVVPLVDYHPEGPAMVLPWMPGGSLSERLAREVFAPARAIEIVTAVLSALGEAHRIGILHRDVKPSNVLFDSFGTARLADFGAAHLGDLSTTATAGAIGTYVYMSPEQRLGHPATLASDVYSAGVLLSELLTGDPVGPAKGERLVPSLAASNDELGSAHDAVLAKLIQEEPSQRPTDAFEAKRILGAVAWPSRVRERAPRAAPVVRASQRPPPASQGRLEPARDRGDGRDADLRMRDTWLDRDVLVHPLDDALLERVRAFARAGHPALPEILRLDLVERVVWIAPPRGRALADAPRGLSPGQVARLREALEALHAASGAHGSVDVEHLYELDGEITLAFPRREPSAGGDTAALDRRALESLAEFEVGQSVRKG